MFQRRKILRPIIDFLKTCPLLTEADEISPMAFDPNSVYAGNALAYTGKSKPQRSRDVNNNIVYNKTASLVMYIRRYVNSPELREEIGDFLFEFENWIEYESEMRGTDEENEKLPKFSDTDVERIWGDNGRWLQVTSDPDINDFLLVIHIEYQTLFEKEGW